MDYKEFLIFSTILRSDKKMMTTINFFYLAFSFGISSQNKIMYNIKRDKNNWKGLNEFFMP